MYTKLELHALTVSLYTDTSSNVHVRGVFIVSDLNHLIHSLINAVLCAKFKEYRLTYQCNKLRIIKLCF